MSLEQGAVLRKLSEFEAAETASRRALRQAADHRQWDTVLSATVDLMDTVGIMQHRTAEGLAYRALAQGLSEVL